jgi:segregation and condensation protein A
VAVTFSAILELLREGLIEIVQSEAFAPIHVRAGSPRHVTLVVDNDRAEDFIEAEFDNRTQS